jgi:hypothetical protein
MDSARGLLTLAVGAIVLLNKDSLPSLNQLTSITDLETNWPLYITLVITAFLFGLAEVLEDNSAQTLMPSVYQARRLRKS